MYRVLAEGGSGVPAENSSDTSEVIPESGQNAEGRRSPGIWGLLASILIAAIVLLFALTQCVPRVPDVRGLLEKEASAELAKAGYVTGTLSSIELSGTPAGRVGEQIPEAGAFLAKGRSVDLVVALGTQMVTVPDTVGNDTPAAELLITRAGLKMNATGQYSSTIPPGAVISQDPVAGTKVRTGTEVIVVVSLGIEPVAGEGWGPSTSGGESAVPGDDAIADSSTSPSECTATYPRASVWSSGGDIYIRLAPGGAARQLTSGPAWDSAPLLAPSARYVVFMRAPSRGAKTSEIGRVCLTTFKSEIMKMPLSLQMKTGHVWYQDYAFGPSRTGTAPGSDWLIVSQIYEYPIPAAEDASPPINVRGRIVVCNVPMASSWVAWNEQFFPIIGLSVSRSSRAGCMRVTASRTDGATATRDFNVYSGMYLR